MARRFANALDTAGRDRKNYCGLCGGRIPLPAAQRPMTNITPSTAHEPKGGWIPALEAATREVFDVMLKTKLEAGGDHLPSAPTEVIAMVGLSGKLRGVVSFHCTSSAARQIAERMLGNDIESVEDAARDAVGEVCNMVAGSFKTRLGTVGDECKLSVPTIISGADCYMQTEPGLLHLEAPFDFEGSPISVALDLRN